MTTATTLAQRLRLALHEAGRSQIDLARACGVKHPAVSFWLSGKTSSLKSENLMKAADYLQVSSRWLSTGEGEMRSQKVPSPEDCDCPIRIPVFTVKPGTSPGETHVYERLPAAADRFYDKNFFHNQLTNPENCRCFRISGDGMKPAICDDDVILVDCGPHQTIISGRVYAFFLVHNMHVKRLFERSSGALLMRSDNPDKDAYPDELLAPQEREAHFSLIGRVIERSGCGNL